ASYKGQSITLGIRPEDLREARGSNLQDVSFDAVVEVVEPLGAETLLDTRVGGQTIVARVDPTVNARHHAKIRLAYIPERLHFFDNQTEEAITGHGEMKRSEILPRPAALKQHLTSRFAAHPPVCRGAMLRLNRASFVGFGFFP